MLVANSFCVLTRTNDVSQSFNMAVSLCYSKRTFCAGNSAISVENESCWMSSIG